MPGSICAHEFVVAALFFRDEQYETFDMNKHHGVCLEQWTGAGLGRN